MCKLIEDGSAGIELALSGTLSLPFGQPAPSFGRSLQGWVLPWVACLTQVGRFLITMGTANIAGSLSEGAPAKRVRVSGRARRFQMVGQVYPQSPAQRRFLCKACKLRQNKL